MKSTKVLLLAVFVLILVCVFPSTASDVMFRNDSPPNGFEFTNDTALCKYCPIWDGDHSKPDPFLVHEFHKKIVADTLKAQGKTTQQIQSSVLSLQPPPYWRGMPTKGTVKIPVFLVDFSDAPPLSKTRAMIISISLQQ
jgi:hypothetical protein